MASDGLALARGSNDLCPVAFRKHYAARPISNRKAIAGTYPQDADRCGARWLHTRLHTCTRMCPTIPV